MTPECKPSVTRTKTFCREQKARKILLSAYLSEARNLAQNRPLRRLLSSHSAAHSYSGACYYWLGCHDVSNITGSLAVPAQYSMRSRIYDTERCPSVFCPCVCPSTGHSSKFSCRGAAGGRYRSTAARRTAARCAAGGCGQCHVVSVVADQTC